LNTDITKHQEYYPITENKTSIGSDFSASGRIKPKYMTRYFQGNKKNISALLIQQKIASAPGKCVYDSLYQ